MDKSTVAGIVVIVFLFLFLTGFLASKVEVQMPYSSEPQSILSLFFHPSDWQNPLNIFFNNNN